MINEKFTFIVPISLLILLIVKYLSVFGYDFYFYFNFAIVSILTIYYLALVIRSNKIVLRRKVLSLVVILFSIYTIIFSRNMDYFEHSIITALMLMLFLIFIPEYTNHEKYSRNICYSILVFTLVLSFNVIVNNYSTLTKFLSIGFRAKDFVVPVFRNINYDANVLVYGVFSSFFLWQMLKKKKYCLFLVIHLFALFLTYSRTSYLVILIMILIYMLYVTDKTRKVLFFLSTLPLLIIIILLIFNEVLVLDLNGQGNDLLSGRTIIWEQAKAIISNKLWFGYGLYYWQFQVSGFHSTHNSYLNYLIEYGLIGVSQLMFILIGTFNSGLNIVKKSGKSNKAIKILNSFFIGLLVGMFFEMRRIGGVRLMDFLPLLILSMILAYANTSINNNNKINQGDTK